MARNKLTTKDRSDIKALYRTDPVKWTKYKLAAMHGVSWRTIHFVIDEEAAEKNRTANRERAFKTRKESK